MVVGLALMPKGPIATLLATHRLSSDITASSLLTSSSIVTASPRISPHRLYAPNDWPVQHGDSLASKMSNVSMHTVSYMVYIYIGEHNES